MRLLGHPRELALSARTLALNLFTLLSCAFVVAPLLIIFLNSFNSAAYSPFPPPGYSLEWYRKLFSGVGEFGPAAQYTVVVAVLSTIVALVAGTLAAYAIERLKVPGAGGIRAAMLVPMVLPKMALGVGLFIFFAKLQVYGTRWTLVLAHAMISLPFVVVIVSAALAGMDRSQEEAARDLGASWAHGFRRVVLPQIRSAIIVSGLFSFIVSADQLESTIFLTRPGTETLPVAMFNYTLQYQDPLAAALSSLVIGASLLLMAAGALLVRRGDMIKMLRNPDKGLR